MGKTALRRKNHRREYLAKLSYENPKHFQLEWEIGVTSWLEEIQTRSKDWANGREKSNERIFEVLEEAMGILAQCEKSIYQQYATETYDLLCHECCSEVSRVIDRRLYRLSNINDLIYKARRTTKG
ncbi:MAG TPA: hypothetical protein ENN18_08870 [Proteobacteria bacterium]|nr:hypothetical protein [Pseudomonadota bacterium]